MLADALEHLVSGIVANPDDVRVREKDLRRGRMLEVRVLRVLKHHPEPAEADSEENVEHGPAKAGASEER